MADASEYSPVYASVVQPPDGDGIPPDLIQLPRFDALQGAGHETIRIAISLLVMIMRAFFEAIVVRLSRC